MVSSFSLKVTALMAKKSSWTTHKNVPIISDDRRYSQNCCFDGHMVGQLREGDGDTKTLMTNMEGDKDLRFHYYDWSDRSNTNGGVEQCTMDGMNGQNNNLWICTIWHTVVSISAFRTCCQKFAASHKMLACPAAMALYFFRQDQNVLSFYHWGRGGGEEKKKKKGVGGGAGDGWFKQTTKSAL